jgi:hypothetical protein
MPNPTTKLAAVNIMLSTIGEAPITDISSTLLDAQTAVTILDNINNTVQAKGWAFNTEFDKTITQIGGEIVLPTNTAKADLAQTETKFRKVANDYVIRGDASAANALKMYDTRKQTFSIGKDLKLDLVLLLDFEQIPELARRYIAIKASRVFQERVLGSRSLSEVNRADEQEALFDLKEADGSSGDYNIFDDYSAYGALDRGPHQRVI